MKTCLSHHQVPPFRHMDMPFRLLLLLTRAFPCPRHPRAPSPRPKTLISLLLRFPPEGGGGAG
eukprot:398846-Pyramimonas_sp.AAC.1